MNSNNVVFKNESGEDPFNSDKLKHIHDAEWNKLAYDFYNDKLTCNCE